MPLERPLSPKVLAQYLSVSPRTITNLCKQETNPLPHIVVGTSLRIFLSDAVKYFGIAEDKLHEPNPAAPETTLTTLLDGALHHE